MKARPGELVIVHYREPNQLTLLSLRFLNFQNSHPRADNCLICRPSAIAYAEIEPYRLL